MTAYFPAAIRIGLAVARRANQLLDLVSNTSSPCRAAPGQTRPS